MSTASQLATRLCHIATKFGNKEQECKDLVAASKELLLLDESKGGKWCKKFDHWIAVNAAECNVCLVEKHNSQVFSVARVKINEILEKAGQIYEHNKVFQKHDGFEYSELTPKDISIHATRKGISLFKKRDWDGNHFTLPQGLLSSIWECFEIALVNFGRAAAIAERKSMEDHDISEMQEKIDALSTERDDYQRQLGDEIARCHTRRDT